MNPVISTDEQLKRTLVLGVLAVFAFGCMILAAQFVQQRQFWRDIDDWRTNSRFGEFLQWEREHPEGNESEND